MMVALTLCRPLFPFPPPDDKDNTTDSHRNVMVQMTNLTSIMRTLLPLSVLCFMPLSAAPITIDFRDTPDFGGFSLTYEIDGVAVRHSGGAVTAAGLDLSSDHVSFFEGGLAMKSLSFTLKSGGFLRFYSLNSAGSFNPSTDVMLIVDQPDQIAGLPDEFRYGFDIYGEGVVLHSIELETDPAAEVTATRFLRGDSNGDGTQNIVDPVFTLLYLFSDASAPGCLDALDVDDDGQINLADPIGHLTNLFLGGIRPHEPFLRCGEDPSEDSLGCEFFPPCRDMKEEIRPE